MREATRIIVYFASVMAFNAVLLGGALANAWLYLAATAAWGAGWGTALCAACLDEDSKRAPQPARVRDEWDEILARSSAPRRPFQ